MTKQAAIHALWLWRSDAISENQFRCPTVELTRRRDYFIPPPSSLIPGFHAPAARVQRFVGMFRHLEKVFHRKRKHALFEVENNATLLLNGFPFQGHRLKTRDYGCFEAVGPQVFRSRQRVCKYDLAIFIYEQLNLDATIVGSRWFGWNIPNGLHKFFEIGDLRIKDTDMNWSMRFSIPSSGIRSRAIQNVSRRFPAFCLAGSQ